MSEERWSKAMWEEFLGRIFRQDHVLISKNVEEGSTSLATVHTVYLQARRATWGGVSLPSQPGPRPVPAWSQAWPCKARLVPVAEKAGEGTPRAGGAVEAQGQGASGGSPKSQGRCVVWGRGLGYGERSPGSRGRVGVP